LAVNNGGKYTGADSSKSNGSLYQDVMRLKKELTARK